MPTSHCAHLTPALGKTVERLKKKEKKKRKEKKKKKKKGKRKTKQKKINQTKTKNTFIFPLAYPLLGSRGPKISFHIPFGDLGSGKLMLTAEAIEVQGTKISSKQYWENRSIQVQ